MLEHSKEKSVLIFAIIFFLITLSCSDNDTTTNNNNNNNNTLDTLPIEVSFTQIMTVPSFVGSKFIDISFADSLYGALIYENNNTIYITNDNGYTWSIAAWNAPYGFPLRCISIKRDGSEIFAGTTVGRYAILNGNADSLIYSGEISFYSNNQTVNYHFTSAYYNFEGGLWASVGNDLKNEGMVLLKYSTTYSIWEDISKNLYTNHYVSSVVRKRYGDVIVGLNGLGKGIYAKYSNANQFTSVEIETSEPYQYECPLSLSLNKNEKLLAAYGGTYNNNRLYITSYSFSLTLWKKIIHTGIVGNIRSAKFDAQNYIWVCTDQGLFKSTIPLN